MPTMQASMRTILVEDEPHARQYLRELLAEEEGVAVVGEASGGVEGIGLIRKLLPDLVFLDIQMPELDGFKVIEEIGSESMPALVFVTAYSEYAVRAFDVEAVDYLCKPFDRDRLAVSLERAMRRLEIRNGRAAGDLDKDTAENQWLPRLAIRDEKGITFVPVDQILWIEAANKYAVIHTPGGTHITRQTIQSLHLSLDPKQFVRIHRSTLVRKDAVRGLHPLFHGDYIVKLKNGAELTLSRNFRQEFFRQMSR
jgi:two-component system, LytTR family, response regulator